MPATIPYDPSLVLGQIVDPETISTLQQIAEKQAPIDAARDRMNSLVRLKMSLDMTRAELVALGCKTDDLDPMIRSAEQQVREAAEALAREIMKAQS